MGNAYKQLFFGPTLYLDITCSICNSLELDTWKHVLLFCTQQYIHILIIKRHNKAIWEIYRLITQYKTSWCYMLMNVGTYNGKAPHNIVPHWLSQCTCINMRCHCPTRLKPDLLCIQGLSCQSNSPTSLDQNITIQFIKFIFCTDRFSSKTIKAKINKYQPFIGKIQELVHCLSHSTH